MFFDRYTYEITPWLRTVQRILVSLIIIGLFLLATQMFWVPPLVSYLLQHEQSLVNQTVPSISTNESSSELDAEIVVPTSSVSIRFDEAADVSVKEIVPPLPDKVSKGPTKQCVVSGCSGQLCTDDPTMMSTCEYRPEYACYARASCTRQETGECGWTKTPELTACLLDTDAAR